MTAHIYPAALIGFRDETLDWTAEQVKAVFLGPSFQYDDSAVYASDLPSEHVIATSDELANRTFEDDLAYGDAAPFLQLLSSVAISHVVLIQDTGDPAYSLLIAHYDTDSIIGAPKTPIGEDEFVYCLFPPGGFFQIVDEELVGPISTGILAGNFSLAELDGGLAAIVPSVALYGRLTVTTHVVCVGPDEPENCCQPTIRSSRCL